MGFFYKPVTIVYENVNYNTTCTSMQPNRILLTVYKPARYLFIFNNWDREGPGVLIIYKKGNGWSLDESSAIKDMGLAQAAGKCIDDLS